MKKVFIFLGVFLLTACDEEQAKKLDKPASTKADLVIKQPFSLSDEPQTKTDK